MSTAAGSAAFVMSVDRALAAELNQALDIYGRWRRTNGLPPAKRLTQLAESWSGLVRAGQDRPDHQPQRDDVDNGLVPSVLVNESETARLLGVSERTVRRRAAAGELVAVRIGAAKRYRKADIEAYIDSLTPEGS